MLRFRDILVPIRIRGSVPLTHGSDFGSCYFRQCIKVFLMIEGFRVGSVPRTKYPDPDLGGLKTYGSYGSKSGYATLLDRMLWVWFVCTFRSPSYCDVYLRQSCVFPLNILFTSCFLPALLPGFFFRKTKKNLPIQFFNACKSEQ